MTDFSAAERRAIGLYAVLDRDWGDFIDMMQEEPADVLELLREMLVCPNPKHDARTVELNRIGASIVDGVLTRRAR